MKKITLLLGMVVAASVGFSQIIFDVTSAPTCTSLEHSWNFEIASSDGTQAGWGASPNMFQGVNSITADMEMVDDGTTPGTMDTGGSSPHDTSQDACDSTTWSQDLTGKIAVLFRGACEFGLKSFNAQKRGAVAVLIINHTGDAIPMGGGTYGPQVTIPVIMVSETDGNQIAACLNGGGTMTAFLGSKIGLYPNDMGSSPADIVMAESTANPYVLSQNGTELNLDLGLWAYNLGVNAQTGVTCSVDVSYMGSSVYANTSAPVNFNAPDTSFVDTQYIALGNHAPASWGAGVYTITYTVSTPGGTDGDASDNTVVSQFKITSDNVYAKSRIDASNNPIQTTAYSLNETTTAYDEFQPCVQFKNDNASRLMAAGMTFSCAPVGETMANEIVDVRAYTWDDSFTDLNDAAYPGTAWTMTQVGDGGFYFYLDETEENVNIYLPFQTPFALVDGQRYLFCVYNASDSLRVGYDAQIDYTSTVNNYLEASGPVGILPAGGAYEWYAAGFGYDVTPAVTVNFDITPVSVADVEDAASAIAYPNPVANLLNVPVRKSVTGSVQVEVFDLAGKLVLSENKTIVDGPLQINVASIANGSYVFKMTFANGTQDTFKVSVNR